jgi:hypothetical protein
MKYTINELANSKGVSQPVREALLQMADYKQLYEQVCEQYDVLAKELETIKQALAAQPAPVSNETMQKLREKLESPSYTHALAYQNIREALEIVMRWIDDYCETGPENDFERVEKIANAALEVTPPAQPAPVQERCEYCDGTGDVHDRTGEWRGVCNCEAGRCCKAPVQPVENKENT